MTDGAQRVAYVGNFTRPHCTEVHVAASLESLGHTVFRLQENTVNFDAIPRLVRSRRATLLMWTRTWSTPLDVGVRMLDALRAQGVPSVSYHLDRWMGLGREPQLRGEPFFRTDLVVTADGTNLARWEQLGINHRWLPPGVYGPECAPIAANRVRWPHDVVFVGSHPYPHAEWEPTRTAMIDALRRRFGERFAVWPDGRAIRGRSLSQLYASARVVVGDSCLVPPCSRYWSDRVPETLGRGGYLVHPDVGGLADWYPDLETYTVGDHAELVDLVNAALDDEPERVATIEKQRALVLSRDTYAHRMATVLEWVKEIR